MVILDTQKLFDRCHYDSIRHLVKEDFVTHLHSGEIPQGDVYMYPVLVDLKIQPCDDIRSIITYTVVIDEIIADYDQMNMWTDDDYIRHFFTFSFLS